MRSVIKKSVIKISLAFVIIAAVLLVLVGLLSIDGDGTAPSYRFLGGRKPTVCKYIKTKVVDKFYAYSFEADFNDVCSNAKAELIPAGFIDNTQPLNEYIYHDYWQKNRFPQGAVWIFIYNNREYIENPISKNGRLVPRDGWVVVMIMYWRGWRWPF
jgi:hypothetical protein